MKKVVAFLVLAFAALALVACGGGSDTSSTPTSESSGAAAGGGEAEGGEAEGGEAEGGGASEEAGGSTVAFESDPGGGIAYTSDTATASAGKVTVNFNNPQALEHDVAIEDSGGQTIGKTELVTEGSDSTTVDLKPGTYTYYCTVPGHREAGMEGTLTVE